MMYHLHINSPEDLTEEQWANRHRQLLWVLDFENKRYNLGEGETLPI